MDRCGVLLTTSVLIPENYRPRKLSLQKKILETHCFGVYHAPHPVTKKKVEESVWYTRKSMVIPQLPVSIGAIHSSKN